MNIIVVGKFRISDEYHEYMNIMKQFEYNAILLILVEDEIDSCQMNENICK